MSKKFIPEVNVTTSPALRKEEFFSNENQSLLGLRVVIVALILNGEKNNNERKRPSIPKIMGINVSLEVVNAWKELVISNDIRHVTRRAGSGFKSRINMTSSRSIRLIYNTGLYCLAAFFLVNLHNLTRPVLI